MKLHDADTVPNAESLNTADEVTPLRDEDIFEVRIAPTRPPPLPLPRVRIVAERAA